MKRIMGIDEAGRGAVIGPLIIAGALIDEKDEEKLREIGVRDSKLLSHKQRGELHEKLPQILADSQLERVSAAEIDSSKEVGINLNELEAIKSSKIINNLKPDTVFIDAVDTTPLKYQGRLAKHLSVEAKLVIEHKADSTYPIVSAASILAKEAREEAISELKEEVGDFGSGYPSDPLTKEFLTRWINEHNSFPEWVRHSWKTVSVHLEAKTQKSLGEYK
ncbi:MAG: ribonuclease HII [Candidatus Pacebacteria bacterium]|jgi:ribonuclease HII|nr:ribonuclease HII [Euryarchaeota archaeon]MDP6527657.1 ribonuclease HII [Candidatus Paceibacterota bacterium]|tara:strand:- start:17677 stop:18336 length:660 start_codon:yes stop_codon:yes gene_type:complete